MSLPKTFLAIGISIIFAVFVSYGLAVLYESPKEYERSDCYDNYNCFSMEYGSEEYEACQENLDKCQEDFSKQTSDYKHSRNSFYILVVIGIVAIIAGFFLVSLEGISGGLMGGGVLTVLWALIYTWSYWFTFNKYVKLFVLAIVLALLIYLGYKKIEGNRR